MIKISWKKKLKLENQLLMVSNLNKLIPLRLQLTEVLGNRFKIQDSIPIPKILILMMMMINFRTNKTIIFNRKSIILNLYTEIKTKN
jgi:hypothetical protein